jgi:hypothetical protein
VRKAWEEKRYREVSEGDLIFRNQVRSRFSGDRFEGLYRSWKNGHISDSAIRHAFGTNDRNHTVSFETFVLRPISVAQVDSAVLG